MYKKLQKEISNSNPRNPLIHHWPKAFLLFSAKSNIQISKIKNSKIQIFKT
jgi:hypothetical protein